MKKNWEYKKLGDVCSLIMGQSPDSSTYNESNGMPFFQGNADFGVLHPSVRVYCSAPVRIAQPNDILISVRAPIGALNIANKECCIGRGLAAVQPTSLLDNMFVYRFLTAVKDRLVAQGTGSTFKSIGKDALKNLEIPVPPMSEQERIVAELDLLNGVLEKQKAQLKELDTLAQSIFYNMFGDPIENPKGWDVVPFGALADFKNGLNFSSDESGLEYFLVGVSDFQSKAILDCDSNLKTVNLAKSLQEDYLLKDGDILFVRSNGNKELIARNVLIKSNGRDVTYSGFCIRARIMHESIQPFFANSLLKLPSAHKALTSRGRGCNIANLNQGTLNGFGMIVPPLSLQQAFADKIASIEKQKASINQSIAETQKLLDYTMDKYFG